MERKVKTNKRNAKKTKRAKAMVTRKSAPEQAMSRWRFAVTVSVFLLVGVLIFWRIITLQVLPTEYLPETQRGFEFLQRYGRSQVLRTEEIDAHRGVITDRNGEPLAVSSPVQSLWANPQELIGQEKHWQSLAKALQINSKSLADKINAYANREFMYLQRAMVPADAQAVLALNIPGVYARQEYQRFYPAGDVAAHVVGVTNIDDQGQEGLELAFNDWLKGEPGSKRILKDLKGRVIEDVHLIKAAQPGKELELSIDLRLQYHAHTALQNAVLRHRAVGGSIVVLDVESGEVLAMVNQPTYNPNNRGAYSADRVRNRAMIDNFEPGSTMKTLTLMAAFESGDYSPSTRIDTSPGYLKIPGKAIPVQDPRNYGVIDLKTVLSESSQVGISRVALRLDPNDVRNVFYRFGFGEITGSGFPGETRGILRNVKSKWHPTEIVSQAYGYGLTVNALQLAQAYNIFANYGVKKPVSLLKVENVRDLPTERVLDERLAKQALSMLEHVLNPDGTGARAKLDYYTAGGKTGTARKVGEEGYDEDAENSVFVGIAPINKPRIVVSILINEARNGLSGGGAVAAPVFKEVAEASLRLLNVTPDEFNPQLTQSELGARPRT